MGLTLYFVLGAVVALVETGPYLASVARMIRAAGRRVAQADEVELAQLVQLHEVLSEATTVAVAGMRARGCSWAYVGSALGITRQSAQERWGEKRTA